MKTNTLRGAGRRAGAPLIAALALSACSDKPIASIDTNRRGSELSGTIYLANTDAGIQYVYDPVGRLVGVMTPTGDVAQYVYDAAGNIKAINRGDAGVVTVVGFNDSNVNAGQSLIIYGSGFSTTLANDTVKINGVTATVTAATEGQLTVTVPSNTDGGTVTVTVGTQSSNSSTPITVGSSAAPTITGFAPDAGLPDASFTIYGTGFDPNPANDLVFVNQSQSNVLSATATTLQVTVPTYAVSGRVTVANANGTVVSPTDFWISPPSPSFPTSELIGFGRTFVDGGVLTVPIDAGVATLVLFDGTKGESIGLEFGPNLPKAWLFDPQGDQLFYGIPSVGSSPHYFPLPFTGTYEVAFEAEVTPATTTVQLGPSPINAIATDGGLLTFVANQVSDIGVYTFQATTGQSLSVALTGNTLAEYTATVYDANGLSVVSQITPAASTVLDVTNVGDTGTFTVEIVPQDCTGQVSIQVFNDATGLLATDGGVLSGTLSAGQRGDYAFTGVGTQFLGLGISNVVATPTGTEIFAYIDQPVGQILWTLSSFPPGGNLQFGPIANSGTFYVRIEPSGATAATFDLALLPSTTAALTLGTPTTFVGGQIGQGARYTLAVTAGQDLSILLSGCTFTHSVVAYLYNPSGSLIASGTATATADVAIDLAPAATTGTYVLTLDPSGTDTGQVTVTAMVDATGQLLVDGGLTSITLSEGQRGEYTFGGTQGQYLGFGAPTLSTTPVSRSVTFTVTDLAGQLATFAYTAASSYAFPSLPDSGIYTVRVEPSGATAATVGVNLTPSETGTLISGGSSVLFSTTTVGQDGAYTFSGNSGSNHTLNVTGNTISGTVTLSVYKPSGVLWQTGYVTAATGTMTLTSLPATGTYTVEVVPAGTNTGQLSIAYN